ncbi:hypothetical protein [Thermocatellispora tengchongensis]|uniref:hypothetical protein n=1 Tax=Thermocatellispora tengchongensis TaxID=1073253 RepID=UPI003624B005
MRERVVHLVASVLLGSPDERQAEARPLLARAVEGLPDGEAARALRSFFDRTAGTPVRELAAEHADAFSARRHSSPRLTFYLAATSRERGWPCAASPPRTSRPGSGPPPRSPRTTWPRCASCPRAAAPRRR